MQVETFVDDEIRTEHPEVSSEAADMILALGLEGQFGLVTKPVSQAETRNPYRKITKEERFVYKCLCPTSYAVETYNRSSIPLRVLQVIAHARDFLPVMEVWDKEDGSVDDPVLVGREKKYGDIYLLARWGNELDTFSDLREKAIKSVREQFISGARRAMIAAQAALSASDSMGIHDLMDYYGDPIKFTT